MIRSLLWPRFYIIVVNKKAIEPKRGIYDAYRDITMFYCPPIISVEEFFHDDPNTAWKPLPEHLLL